jgi:hypothetical protein
MTLSHIKSKCNKNQPGTKMIRILTETGLFLINKLDIRTGLYFVWDECRHTRNSQQFSVLYWCVFEGVGPRAENVNIRIILVPGWFLLHLLSKQKLILKKIYYHNIHWFLEMPEEFNLSFSMFLYFFDLAALLSVIGALLLFYN